MKLVIPALTVCTLCLRAFAADTQPGPPTPQDVARQVITVVQTGHTSDIKANLAADVAILEKGTHDFPADPQLHFALGSCYMMQDNKEAGANSMEKAYTLSQKNPVVGAMYALALKMNKQLMKAYEVDQEMAAAHPDVPGLQAGLAVLDITIQKYDEAIAILEMLQQKAPANLAAKDKSSLLFMLGICHLYKGEHPQAIDALETSLALTPNMAMDLTVLGEAYLKAGNLEKATVALDKALAINPNIPPALYHRGIIYEKAGNAEMAMKSFNDAYTYGKQRLQDNGEDYYLMFLLCEKLSKKDEGAGYKSEAAKLLFTYEAPAAHDTPPSK